MTDHDPWDGEIPAFIRTLLDPFVNVHGAPPRDQSRTIETTFITPLFRPSDSQLKAMGRVTSTWSVLEHIIEIALARLALTPQFPALALTNDLGLDNRIKALKALIALHHERYAETILEPSLIRELEKIPAQIATLKDKRNRLTHLVWIRDNDDVMSGLRPRARTASAVTKAPASQQMTVAEINELADAIQALADTLFVLTQMVPEVDEGQHAQSLAQSARRLRPDTE